MVGPVKSKKTSQQGLPSGVQEGVWEILGTLEPWRGQSQTRKGKYGSRSRMEPKEQPEMGQKKGSGIWRVRPPCDCMIHPLGSLVALA